MQRIGPLIAAADLRARPLYLPLVLIVTALACANHLHEVWRPYRFLSGDGTFYYGVSRHLFEAGTLEQHGNHPASWYTLEMGWNHDLPAEWSNIALGRDGKAWYPKHPLLLPLLALPFVFALGPLGALAFEFLLCLLLAAGAHALGKTLGGPLAGLAAGLLLGLTPVLADQIWSLSNDLLQAVLVVWATDLALRARPGLAGGLLGLGVLAKMTTVLLLPGFALFYLLRRDLRGASRFALASSLGIGTFALTNTILFGSPFVTAYQRILVRVGGELQLHSHVGDFAISQLPAKLLAICSGPGGLLRRTPYLVIAPLLLLPLAFRRRLAEASLLTVITLAPVLFHAPYAWYRIAFLLPSIAVAAALAAQAVVLFREPEAPAPHLRVQPGRIAAALVIALFAYGGVTRLVAGPPTRLSERIREARVGQGEIPCDYFNNPSWQWECSGFDRGDDRAMTGPAVARPFMAGGVSRPAIRLTPGLGPGARWIAWTLPERGPCTLHLEHGMEDGSHAQATIEIHTETGLLRRLQSHPGWQSIEIPLPVGARTLRIEARGTRRAPLGLDGTITCA